MTTRGYGAVAGLCVVALVAGCATTSGVRVAAAPAASAQPTTPATALPGEVFSPEAAHAKQVAMLALVHVPPGSTELPVSPTTDLTHAQSIGADNFLDLPTWYSVPMSQTQFAAYLKANPPQGFAGGGGVLRQHGHFGRVRTDRPELCRLLDCRLLRICGRGAGGHPGRRPGDLAPPEDAEPS